MPSIETQLADEFISLLCSRDNGATLLDAATGHMSVLMKALDIRARLKTLTDRPDALPAHALWGASQSGKSTTLKRLFDGKAADDGTGSALHFPGGAPFRFSEKTGAPVADAADIHVFNPYNAGSDATGCVTRFHAGAPKYLSHPVRITLGSLDDFRLALAIGYTERCQQPPEARPWDGKLLEARLTEFKAFRAAAQNRPVSVESVKRVHEFVETLRHLSRAGYARFAFLKNSLDELRVLWARDPVLANPAELKNWINIVLWDDKEALNHLVNRVEDFIRKFERQRPPDGEFFCPLAIAARLVDISAYAKIGNPGKHYRLHERLVCTQKDGDMVLDLRDPGLRNRRDLLCEDKEEFAIFQALIWEMEVCLNTQNITSTNFKSFMEKSDLLDFPGVPRGGTQDNIVRIDVDNDNPDPLRGEASLHERLFSDALKLGRTVSIIYRNSKNFNVDGMTLLLPAGDSTPYSSLIVNGVGAWLGAVYPEYMKKVVAHPKKSPLPLNLMITRGCKFSNDCWGRTPVEINDLLRVPFSYLDNFSFVFKTEVLHKIFFSNTPDYDKGIFTTGGQIRVKNDDDGEVKPEYKDDFDRVYERLVGPLKSGDIRNLKTDDTDSVFDSFRAMSYAADGGIEFFYAALAEQSKTYKRASSIQETVPSDLAVLQKLLEDQIPPKDANEANARKTRFFEEFISKVERFLEKNRNHELTQFCSALKDIFFINWETFGEIGRTNLDGYISMEIEKWKNEVPGRLAKRRDLLTLFSIDTDEIKTLVNYCAETINPNEFAQWHAAHHLDNVVDSRSFLRRHAALWLANQLPLRRRRQNAPLPKKVEENIKGSIAPEKIAFFPNFLAALKDIGETKTYSGNENQNAAAEVFNQNARNLLDRLKERSGAYDEASA